MKELSWTEKELQYLVKHWHKITNKEIAEKLGKTESAVRQKANRYITFEMVKKRKWSEYEKEMLQKLYGTMPIEDLSERMKRSVRSIKEEIKILEGTYDVTVLREIYGVSEITGYLGIIQATLYHRVKRGEIPCYKLGKRNVIDKDVFWEWLKENLDKVNYKGIKEEYELSAPDWFRKVIVKKKFELRNSRKNANWTSKEDALLWSEMLKGSTYGNIAKELNRSMYSVSHRARVLSKKKMGKVN